MLQRGLVSHLPSRLVCAALVFTACACAHSKPAPTPQSGPPRPVQLLAATPERESSQFEDPRADVEVDTRDFDRQPRVVAVGETPLLELKGARARLYGDADGQTGWSVDNFILFEVLDDAGALLSRGNAGFAQGVKVGPEHIDNLGQLAFAFGPGEIDITRLLPEGKPFRVRATALDVGGVGRVTDVWLVLEYPDGRGDDDLRNQ